ncbi:MAG: polyprenyl synthetase [Burkholderiales bacterium PBB6]|nr:MAG: polyprenyl synthetase [Burkholderiales bacterium PBB6]
MNAGEFDDWIATQLKAVEAALEELVPADAPAGLGLAMRYAVLDGGKRLRPLLVMAACEAVGGDEAAAMRAAVAVELIHAYSLVHDDMPCMDDDALRRGKPTVHVKFGEAQAMLAGDAMQALAFDVLTPDEGMPAALQARLVSLLARSAGHAGMAGGQAIDLASVGRPLDEATLRDMHRRKTGALLEASVLMGAACGATTLEIWQQLSRYGAALGLAFQVVDDILDVTEASETLGKTAGKDQDNNKPTYVSMLGLEESRAYACRLRSEAHAALAAAQLSRTACLTWLADRVVDRNS